MKYPATLALLAVLLTQVCTAQERVSEDQLHGAWQLVIDLDQEDSDSVLGRLALKAVGGLLDEIDVSFVFEPENRLRVAVEAFGEADGELDESTWTIDRNGLLHLGESDAFDSDDTVWMWQDGQLRAFDRGDGKTPGEMKGLYLVRLQG